MTLGELKGGFFGYRKAGVYQYIIELEEQFAAKLEAMGENTRKLEAQYQRRIGQLEQERDEARRQCQLLLQAEEQRQQSEAEQRQEQLRLQEETQQQSQLLAQYRRQVEQMREMFRAMLAEVDGKAEALDKQLERVQEACPEHNLSLFQRKTEQPA